jgi:pimeloyl-ACP methyl ester carboxylesterase
MPTATNGSYQIYYEVLGSADDPAVLLVCGFTGQLISWRDDFCKLLVDQGYRVIRFDNRDVGLSTKTEGPGPNLGAIRDAVRSGEDPAPPYSLADMASDAVAVLDDAGVERAHVMGVSMGGMIAQRIAIDHPGRVASLTSVMSTPSNRDGRATPEAMAALTTPPPSDRDGYVEHSVATARVYSGPHFDETDQRELAGAAYDRCFHPRGAAFHMAAIMAAPDRTPQLELLDVPTMVIHGRIDPLIQLDGGEATAAAVPGAVLRVYDDMGHDFPRALWPEYVEDLTSVARRALS